MGRAWESGGVKVECATELCSFGENEEDAHELVCPAGDRGDGGTCDCDGAPGWFSGGWDPPFCYEGKCYSRQEYAPCQGKDNGHSLTVPA